MVVAAYCTVRAIEAASTRWLLGAGVVMGLSFLAKGLQPFTLLPALTTAYAVAAPTSLRRRLLQLLGAGAALVAAAGWWVLAVQLTPASARPYIGGSGDNSALGLAFGYNGLSRLSGSSQGGPGGSFSGATGIGRLFNSLNGGQIAWLLPTAVIGLIALVAVSRRAPLTDRTRAAAIIWGGWLLVTGLVLSFAGGVIHTYYTVELAPAIAALVATGVVTLWRARGDQLARFALAAAAVLTGTWSYALLHRTPSFHPWVGWPVVIAAFVTAALVVLPILRRELVVAAIAAGAVTLAGGPTAYALDTAATAHTGSTPSAGPTLAGAGFGGRSGGAGFGGRAGGGLRGGMSGETPDGTSDGPSGGTAPDGSSAGGGSASAGGGSAFPGGGGGRPGGGEGATVSSALIKLLKNTSTTWAAATIGSQQAAPLELASGKSVISIGGFTGSDNAPTLTQFKQWVAEGKIRYFVGGAAMGGRGGNGGAASEISQWVSSSFKSTTVGNSTVYDLTKPAN
jgi:4-amino-4-deoxy-L-arabinose transferase-like glycosyltransferase